VSPTCPPDYVGESSALGNTVEVSYDSGTGTATVGWSSETETGPFNVYSGNRLAGGPWAYNHTCLVSGVVGTSTTDTAGLAAGELAYYLVSRTTAPCSESSLGLDSGAAERPNSNPCP
jgi:hypothetical protein